MRGLQVLVAPLFSAPCGTAGGANDRSIDAPQLAVYQIRLDVRGSQPTQDFVQGAVARPFVEEIPHGRPRSKLLWQITPGRAGPQNPQDAVHDHPPIARRPARAGRRRKYVRDTFPLFVRKPMPSHCNALLGKLNPSARSVRQIPDARKEQFSDKA